MTRRIYPDSCVLIYRIQHVEPWASAIARALEPLENLHFFVTDLTLLECRVFPLRQGDTDLLGLYDRFFKRSNVTRIPLAGRVFDLATELRAAHPLKTPDALHLAAAISAGCDEFLTNNQRLAKAAANRIRIVAINEETL
jgi:predicted nucleic acid-binding protein